VTPCPESLGHIQARCPALQEPRIAVHHGIWRELLTAISRNSVESHDVGTRKWYFPSAVSEAIYDEWTVRRILVHLDLFSDIKSLRADITDFHARQGIVLTDVEITSFCSLRPDGVAFDDKNKHCVLLEFTRPMDSVGGRLGGEKGTREERQIRNAHLLHQPSQRPSRSSLELYTSQLHSGSTGLPQTNLISRQAPPPRSFELQSQRKNPSAHSLKNTSLA